MKIEINDIYNHLDSFDKIEEILQLIVDTALKTYVDQINYTVSVEVIDSISMQALNKEHRNIDKDTDVLSFPIFENLRADKSEIEFLPIVELGDIFISWDKVLKQAQEFKVSNFDEFIHLFIHGFLHLLGFDHEISKEEEDLMKKCEEMLLSVVSRHLSA